MTRQEYGQFCGLARALEVVGQPWALMVVRDLLTGPLSFPDLHHGLPRAHAHMLIERLQELEQAGVVMRSTPAAPAGSPVYELTPYGHELNDIVLELGRWGAKTLGGPRRDEIVTDASMVMALRTTFRPEAARGLRMSYLLLLGPITLHVRINDGQADIGLGSIDDPDLTIEAGPALKSLMSREMSAREAIETGSVQLTGDPLLLEWFAEIFHIPPAPPASSAHPVSADTVAGTPAAETPSKVTAYA
jgi:DNA-binding HxlR family transcriptional regulator